MTLQHTTQDYFTQVKISMKNSTQQLALAEKRSSRGGFALDRTLTGSGCLCVHEDKEGSPTLLLQSVLYHLNRRRKGKVLSLHVVW